jgi:hypothetical protein
MPVRKGAGVRNDLKPVFDTPILFEIDGQVGFFANFNGLM